MFKILRHVEVYCGYKNRTFLSNCSGFFTRNGYKRYSNVVAESVCNGDSVAGYFTGKNVLVTGATGFLGKVLIERLLYNCSQIDSIYVLIREKKGQSIEERVKKMTDVPLFNNIKRTKPGSMKKIIPIQGDIAKHNLALRPEDERRLIDNVSVVFHSAATVKFTDTFKTMMAVNLEGTRKVMELSKRMTNLDTFLYISTAFSNSNRSVIDEILYPPPKTLEDVYNFIKKHGTNEKEIEKYLNGFPNTYTFSKALCEFYVDKERGSMKAIIVRPSIVTPALNSSAPGWCDSWVAATAMFSDVARGLSKVVYGRTGITCDMIPVDYVSNLAIVAAARGNRSNEVMVYNSCSSSANPITWLHALNLYLEVDLERGTSECKATRYSVSSSVFTVSMLSLMRQTVPAILKDTWLRMRGETPRHVEMTQRASLLRDLLRYFTTKRLLINSERAQQLIATLDDKDKVQFPCDPKTINWREYMITFYNGVQKYLLKNK